MIQSPFNFINVVALIQAGIYLSAAAVNAETAPDESVLANETLRILTFAGAISGGFLAVAFFPKQNGTIRQSAIKWLACSLFSGLFSPIVIDQVVLKTPANLNLSLVLAISGGIGMFAWFISNIVYLLLKKRAQKELL